MTISLWKVETNITFEESTLAAMMTGFKVPCFLPRDLHSKTILSPKKNNLGFHWEVTAWGRTFSPYQNKCISMSINIVWWNIWKTEYKKFCNAWQCYVFKYTFNDSKWVNTWCSSFISNYLYKVLQIDQLKNRHLLWFVRKKKN